MTHQELESARVYLARRDRLASIPACTAQALLAYIDELHGIVHDLRQEPGWELGRQEERRAILNLMAAKQIEWDALRRQGQATWDVPVVLASLMAAVTLRGPVAPHLAPDDLRRENGALRAALTAFVNAEQEPMMLERMHRLEVAIIAARRLLGDV